MIMMAKRYVSTDEYGILVTNYQLVSYFRLFWWAHAVNKIVICMTTSPPRMNHSMNEFENSFILARVWETRTADYCWFRFGVKFKLLQVASAGNAYNYFVLDADQSSNLLITWWTRDGFVDLGSSTCCICGLTSGCRLNHAKFTV